MSKTVKRNAIHSGIGDNDDLFVKRPKQEDVTEDFQYAARLRGKKRHDALIYPEIEFDYDLSYKGQTLEVDNEKEYQFNINGHPEKEIDYCVTENKELPVERLWEARACFEAEVAKYNLQYYLNYQGHTGIKDKRTAEYAVDWKAQYKVRDLGDVKDLFTDSSGHFIGYADGSTGWKKDGSHVQDVRNRSFFSGVVAKDMYKWDAYEASFTFKPILNNGEGIFGDTKRYNWSNKSFYNAGKWDDDIVGMIFQAQDRRNFYMMMWEADERVWMSGRTASDLDGINITRNDGEFVDRQDVAPRNYPDAPTNSQWRKYCDEMGWGRKHYRIYKVTNGVMKRVNVSMKGSGKGWVMNNMHRVRVVTTGRNVKIYARTSPSSSEFKMFDFNTDWSKGSFGMFNVSQSVEFHSIEVTERKVIQGRIPETGWDKQTAASKTITTNATKYVKASDSFKNKLPSGISASSVTMMDIEGDIRKSENGSIDVKGLTSSIVVKAKDYTTWKSYSGRIKKSGWFSFNGIGTYTHAKNAQTYMRQQTGINNLILDKLTPVVRDKKTGYIEIKSMTGAIIAHNNSAKDAGTIYSECFIKCGIEEITPDNRTYKTGKLVFADIGEVFRKEDDEFFKRTDLINKKRKYELLQPVWQDPPKKPAKEESEAGCVIEEPVEEDEINLECLNEFDFDGKKLVMWSCEFPLETTRKCFTGAVAAFQGWVTFDPLADFNPNNWTTYLLEPAQATIDPAYDEIKWAGRSVYTGAKPGTKVLIKTTEWYRAIFPADIVNSGLVTDEDTFTAEIPPAPEHFYHPTNTDERMPDKYKKIYFLLDAWDNHPDVQYAWASNPELTTDAVLAKVKNPPQGEIWTAAVGQTQMPLLYTSNINDTLLIMCKEDPRYEPWASGKYIGYGKVNGKRPFYGDRTIGGVTVTKAGKADMVNVSTREVYFPENLVMETLQGPFLNIHDHESPKNPRVEYRLHSDRTLVDFYSDYMDSYIWYTDWHSNWVESENTHSANMRSTTEVPNPLELNPTDPSISDDYNPDNTIIERIEVTNNNPFVKLWINEVKGQQDGLLANYYKYPMTAESYAESFDVIGSYKEWTQNYEVKAYMDVVEIPLMHEDYSVLEVKLNDVIVPKSNSNGWSITEEKLIKLNGTAIQVGNLSVKYSTGTVQNVFLLEKEVGSYREVYVNGELLEPIDYSIENGALTISMNRLYLHDHVDIQSYELSEMYDPTKREYLGELIGSQVDFQEDVPTSDVNPNFQDPYYEGTFCFNWGFKSPAILNPPATAAGFEMMSMYREPTLDFKFNVDMEMVYPVGAPVDISNFTGEWEQWDEDPVKTGIKDGTWSNGPGDWHGPPEEGYSEVINLINQDHYSGWYNPDHIEMSDYVVAFTAESRTTWDNDMYGMTFRWNPNIASGYMFQWDAGGAGINGMAVYRMTCTNPEAIGTTTKLEFTRKRLAYDPTWWDTTAQQDASNNPDRVFYPHRIQVSAIGNKFDVTIDGQLKLSFIDDMYETGAWGPVTRSNPDTYFRDFWMQTFRRVTFQEDATFRMPHELTVDRPLIEGEEPMIDITLDPTIMQTKFESIASAHLAANNINTADVVSKEYYITEDQNEFQVFFSPVEGDETVRPVMSRDGNSLLHAVVLGQYPPLDDPTLGNIGTPPEPDIPELVPPVSPNPNDGFSVSWNGYLYAPVSGVYKFQATVNDGFRLWVKDTELIQEWHVTGEPNYFPTYESSIYLEGGQWHKIRANFFDNVGQALVRLRWAMPENDFERINPEYLTPYLGYRLFAQVKEARPLPWNPMIHNGYYYHEEREHYLYADKIVHKVTPDTFHEIEISPRPQQGSAIIVRDNEGNSLRKVTFYDEEWNLTLENTETFSGNGYAKYYLNYKGIDRDTIKVKVNGVTLNNYSYIFHEEESAIEFMDVLHATDAVEIKYKLLYSYYVDMNASVEDNLVKEDVAKIQLHSNYDADKMVNMEVIYESAKETPYYKAKEIMFNPLLTHNHTGFLYITEQEEQIVKDIELTLSEKTLSNSGKERVNAIAKIVDSFNNPCPNKVVKIYRDGILVKEEATNSDGEVYLYDTPTPPADLISTYQVICEGIVKEKLLNYYVDNEPERYYLDIVASKQVLMAGVQDTAVIGVTLRDPNWNPAGAGKQVKVTYRDTYNQTRTETHTTDAYGSVIINVSGLNEQHGSMYITFAYDMSFEDTANDLYLKVIGG